MVGRTRTLAYPTLHYDLGLAFPSVPEGHVELTKATQPAEYSTRANTLAWYHMNEGNPPPPQYPVSTPQLIQTMAWYHLNEETGLTQQVMQAGITILGRPECDLDHRLVCQWVVVQWNECPGECAGQPIL